MTDLGTGVSVRPLSGDDLDGALTLSSTAGWNQRLDDWRMLLALAPAGSFAAVHDGRIVGTAIGIDYGAFSWIAMMLVDPAHRGRGLGRRLLEAALDAVPADTPVRLDATPMGRPLYQAYGFEDESTITRWTSNASVASVGRRQDGHAEGTANRVRPMTAGDLAALTEQDRRTFNGDRVAVLEWALALAPEYAHVLDCRDDEGLRQYCLGRHGRLFDQIGPVVAVTDQAGQALAEAALANAKERALVLDVFDARREFGTWLPSRGLQPQRPLFRMRRAPRGSAGVAGAGATGESREAAAGHRAGSGPAAHLAAGTGASRQPHGLANRVVEVAILGPEFA